MGQRELFPIIKDTPIVFGLMANDPSLHLYEHLKAIKEAGFFWNCKFSDDGID